MPKRFFTRNPPSKIDVIFVEKVSLIVYIIVFLVAFAVGGKKEGWSALLGGAIVIASFSASAILIWRAMSSAKTRWLYLLLASLKYLLLISACGWLLYRDLVQPIGFIAGTLVIFLAISIAGVVSALSQTEGEHEDDEQDTQPPQTGKRGLFLGGQ